MSVDRSLIAVTANPMLELALREKLRRRAETAGSLGELEPLAVRLGLIASTLRPRFESPQIVVVAADHGLAVDGVGALGASQHLSTAQLVASVLAGQLPLSVFAASQGLGLTVVDAGVAETVAPHPRLLARKIAHGTRNARVNSAMSLERAQAAIRAGMEIGDALPGNAVACAGIGVGALESAALLLSRLTGAKIRDLVAAGPSMKQDDLARLLMLLQGALQRHRDITEPVELLAALGGFEVAMMVGLMLVAAGKRHLIIADGMPAYAALMIASRIAPAVTDYCVFSRSHTHQGLDHALAEFHSSALLELGMESTDGTGATLAWPLLSSAAALLTDVADGEVPALATRPASFDEPSAFASSRFAPDAGREQHAKTVPGLL